MNAPTPRSVRLSLCMIVKDESAELETCLRYARPHVDEIVIVDTGSTDGTQEIARRYADVFDEIEWPGSFSVARNHSLDLATGDFLIILDGDEYIPEEEGWHRIREAIEQPDLAGAVLPVYNVLGDSAIVQGDRCWLERVFRNHPEIRYTGRVHNQISEAIIVFARRHGLRCERVDAEVIHTGYRLDAEEQRAKFEPRLELLRAEYEHPRSTTAAAYYGYQYAIALYTLRRFGEALEVLNGLDYERLSALNGYYSRLLAAQAAMREGQLPVAMIHCEALLAMDQQEPIGVYTTGAVLLRLGKIREGLFMILQAWKLQAERGRDVRFAINRQVLLSTLATVCDQLRLADLAEQFHRHAAGPTTDWAAADALINNLQFVLAEAQPTAAAA